MTWLWIALGVLGYLAGFVVAGAIEIRRCDGQSWGHRYCSHPFGTPAPLLWPVVLVGLAAYSPLWVAAHGSRWLAERETPRERRDRLAVERDERVREQAETIRRLEREAGLSPEPVEHHDRRTCQFCLRVAVKGRTRDE